MTVENTGEPLRCQRLDMLRPNFRGGHSGAIGASTNSHLYQKNEFAIVVDAEIAWSQHPAHPSIQSDPPRRLPYRSVSRHGITSCQLRIHNERVVRHTCVWTASVARSSGAVIRGHHSSGAEAMATPFAAVMMAAAANAVRDPVAHTAIQASAHRSQTAGGIGPSCSPPARLPRPRMPRWCRTRCRRTWCPRHARGFRRACLSRKKYHCALADGHRA